ncbi:MAG: NAD-dependent epimerase/dehydratase family protein [Pyrinomonadaceae bacterium]
MKVLVTGGSGYLGTHVRKFFNADDFSRSSGLDVLSGYDAQRVADYDVVIHLAAYLDKDPANAEAVFLTNVEGTVNLLKNVRKDAVFVFASTKDVYHRFADNYSEVPESCQTLYSGQSALEWSKLIAERYVDYYAAQIGFRACIFRLSNVYAPMTEGTAPNFVGHFADAINRGEPIRLPGGGRPRRDLLYVDDLSSACAAFADSVIRSGTYNLGGGPQNALTLIELVETMERLSGLQAVIDRERPLPAPAPFNYVSDLGLCEYELGWKPAVDIETGLARLFAPSVVHETVELVPEQYTSEGEVD